MMAVDPISEMNYYGQLGFLYVSDVRYDEDDRAFCNPLPDGRVQFRIHTEHGFGEAMLVYNDGAVRAAEMTCIGQDGRFLYWEVFVQPERLQLRYSFALKRRDRPTHPVVYWSGRGMSHVVETPFTLDLEVKRPFVTPDWIKGAVIYQIFPERFANGNPEVSPEDVVDWGSDPAVYQFQGGDLHGIAQNMGYLAELGIEVIYLNPINSSVSNHKYDATDYYHVDPAFGGDAALHELVEAAHGRGIKILLDASFNHCYPQFFAFKDLIENGEESVYKDWFTVYEWPVQVRYRPHLLEGDPRRERFENWFNHFRQVSGVPMVEMDDDGPLLEPTYEAWYGVISMPKIDQTNPETKSYFLDVAAHWLKEFGVDGWRMDVAQFVDDQFWRAFRQVCLETDPNCYMIAEIWGNTSHWLQGDMFDGTMNYLFRDLCVAYFAQGVMTPQEMVDGLTRLDMLYAPQVTAVNQNLLSSHDVPRFRHLSGEQRERFLLATLFKLTMPGAPSIYYGDEIGMTGGGDPDNRRAFPWHARESWDEELLATMKRLIGLRKEHLALKLGSWRPLWVGKSNDAFAYVRAYEGQQIVVVINRARPLTQSYLPVQAAEVDVLFGEADVALAAEGLVVSGMRPWSGVIVEVGS